MAKVEIPKGMLIGLVAVSATAVIGLAFLLGREAGRSASAKLRNEPNVAGAPAAPLAPPSKPVEVMGAPVMQPVPPGPPAPSAPQVSGPSFPLVEPARAAVAAYFQAVENIQPGSGGDPETMAQQIVAGLGKGDMTGFDGMIQQAQAARDRLSAITPPQPCAAYHRESLASLGEGLELMRALKKAISSAEPDSPVLSLADRANALKVRSEALQRQEKALKQRFGLPN